MQVMEEEQQAVQQMAKQLEELTIKEEQPLDLDLHLYMEFERSYQEYCEYLEYLQQQSLHLATPSSTN